MATIPAQSTTAFPRRTAAQSGLGVRASGSRLLSLDVLRALTVILVLGSHMPAIPTDMLIWVRKPLRLWQHTGWVSVGLILVLSGFLISGLLFREYMEQGRIRVGRFWLRRWLKLAPALYGLAAFGVVARLAQGQALSVRSVLGELFFLQDYVGAVWGHTWLVGVVAHFYLVLPIMLVALMRLQRARADPFRLLPALFGLVAVVVLLERIRLNLLVPYTPGSHLLKAHLQMDALFFGVALSYFYHFHPEAFERFFRRWGGRLLLIGVVLVGPLLLLERDVFVVPTIGLTLVFLLAGVLLAMLLVHSLPQTRPMRALGRFGEHAYSVYLWHYPVVILGIPLMRSWMGRDVPWPMVMVVYMAASVVLGMLLARLVEFPVLRARNRLLSL